MQNLTQVLENKDSQALQRQLTERQQTSSDPSHALFSSEQVELTSWFFMRMQNIYGSKFIQQWPDEISLKLAKREFCQNICEFDREQLHIKLERLKNMVGGNVNTDFDWPSVPKALGVSHGVSPDGTNAAAYLEEKPSNRLRHGTDFEHKKRKLAELRASVGL